MGGRREWNICSIGPGITLTCGQPQFLENARRGKYHVPLLLLCTGCGIVRTKKKLKYLGSIRSTALH